MSTGLQRNDVQELMDRPSPRMMIHDRYLSAMMRHFLAIKWVDYVTRACSATPVGIGDRIVAVRRKPDGSGLQECTVMAPEIYSCIPRHISVSWGRGNGKMSIYRTLNDVSLEVLSKLKRHDGGDSHA